MQRDYVVNHRVDIDRGSFLTSLVCLHFREKAIYLSDHLELMPANYMIYIYAKIEEIKTNPCRPCSMCNVHCARFDPHFLLELRFREMSWINLFLCL